MAILALLQALFWIWAATLLQEVGEVQKSYGAVCLCLFFLVVGIFLYRNGQVEGSDEEDNF